ncbi:MAG: inositol monophosphatase family protein [Pseudomonadota bacterium]
MTLTSRELQRLCDKAIEAATAAGRYVAATRPTRVEHKDPDGSPTPQIVTEVDHNSQAMILDVLSPTFAGHDLALLAEESPDDGSRLTKDFFWCIDPIDGTQSFVNAEPGYAVSVGLVSREGLPHIGVVYDPVTHTLYHALRGGGAFRNGEPWELPSHAAESKPTIFTDRSEAKRPSFEPIARGLDAAWGTHGGAVMNAIRCLENPPACYFKLPKPTNGGGCFWDFAATACIYGELGAWVSDAEGARLNLNREDSVYLNRSGVVFASGEPLARRFFDVRGVTWPRG